MAKLSIDNQNLLIDVNNYVFRAYFGATKDPIRENRKPLTIWNLFSSLQDLHNRFPKAKIIFLNDSRSWRKDVSDIYKANRELKQLEDKETYDEIFSIINDFKAFLQTTNALVLSAPKAETDDLMYIFTRNVNAKNVIVSTDSDFYQLLDENTSIFNPISKITINKDFVLDEENNIMNFALDGDGKIKTKDCEKYIDPYSVDNWVDFTLFCKCIRGDKSDNIMSAYPGVRVKGTKRKTGIIQAFNNRHDQTFDYCNFMEEEWTDAYGKKHIVKEGYEANKKLIDLNCIPEDLKISFKEKVFNDIDEYYKAPTKMNMISIMKFMNKYNVPKLNDNASLYAEFFI